MIPFSLLLLFSTDTRNPFRPFFSSFDFVIRTSTEYNIPYLPSCTSRYHHHHPPVQEVYHTSPYRRGLVYVNSTLDYLFYPGRDVSQPLLLRPNFLHTHFWSRPPLGRTNSVIPSGYTDFGLPGTTYDSAPPRSFLLRLLPSQVWSPQCTTFLQRRDWERLK